MTAADINQSGSKTMNENQTAFMVPPLASAMLNAAAESTAQLRARISNVRWDQRGAVDGIAFDLDGATYHADLRGRNRDVLIGYGAEHDASIALRCLLDGDAQVQP